MDGDDVVELYKRHAAAWVKDRLREAVLYEKRWLDRFYAVLPSSAAVLDCGCGAGEPIARYLAGCGCTVMGIDSSPEMIAMFRARLPQYHALVADMRTLTLRERFDGILAWDSFFHLDHDAQRHFLSTARTHLRPRGALMFTSGTSHGEALGTLKGEVLYHASLDPTEYRELIASEGFDLLANVIADPDCRGRTVWLAQLKP